MAFNGSIGLGAPSYLSQLLANDNALNGRLSMSAHTSAGISWASGFANRTGAFGYQTLTIDSYEIIFVTGQFNYDTSVNVAAWSSTPVCTFPSSLMNGVAPRMASGSMNITRDGKQVIEMGLANNQLTLTPFVTALHPTSTLWVDTSIIAILG